MKILITGGARRIGRLLCRRLAAEGHQIIIHCNSSINQAKELKSELGLGHSFICKDLSSTSETESIFPELSEDGNLPDVLINNASTFYQRGLEAYTAAEMQEDFQVNFFSPLLLMRDFKKFCNSGKIINILDRRIETVDPESGPYLFAKKSLRDATLACAADWPNFSVNAVAPGPVLLPGLDTDGEINAELQWVVNETFKLLNSKSSGKIAIQN